MKHTIGIVLAGVLALGCGSDPKSTSIEVAGRLTPATGLKTDDFEVWGPMDDQGAGVGGNGTFKADGYLERTGILFAIPKAGSAAAAALGPESGLYMTPTAEKARFVKTGSIYTVELAGDVAMDATTTVLSMLLMHPSLSHPSAEVGAAQMRWMAARLSSGWPTLVAAAAAYDAALLAQRDFSTDAAFVDPFTQCLDDVAAIPEITPTPVATTTKATLKAPDRSGHAMKAGDPVEVAVNKHLVVAGLLKQVSQGEDKAVVAPGTRNGTGLEYLYEVREIEPTLAVQGPLSPLFTAPNGLVTPRTTGVVVGSGFIPASSYFGYLDVVGLAMKQATSLLASALVETPNRNVSLGKDKLFEVRLFSGGFGFGVTQTQYDFATANFYSQHNAALYQNIAMGVVEAIGVIPGAAEMLAEGDAGKILQAVVVKITTELGAIIAAKGGNVTSDDLYNLIYNVLKTAVDSVVSVASKGAQENGAKRLLGWLVGGGKKAIKMVVGLPGKIAKGGALGNRAFRMTNPESVMEYFIVAVGFQPGDCLPFIKAMSIFFGMPGEDCVVCANMKCGAQCDICGNTCVGMEKTLASDQLAACEVCNAQGMESDACNKAFLKSMLGGAYTPGANQPQEKAHELNVCVVNACEACNTWYMAQQVCKFPD